MWTSDGCTKSELKGFIGICMNVIRIYYIANHGNIYSKFESYYLVLCDLIRMYVCISK